MAGTGFALIRATLLLTSSPADEPVYWAISESPPKKIDTRVHGVHREDDYARVHEAVKSPISDRYGVPGHTLDDLSEGFDLGVPASPADRLTELTLTRRGIEP